MQWAPRSANAAPLYLPAGWPRVLVVGSTAFDTLARVPRFPQADEAVKAQSIEAQPGGCGANAARALARLGHEPTLLSAVGLDFPDSPAARALDGDGVDLSQLVHARDHRTARAVMATDDQLQQAIVYDEGATPAMQRLEPVQAGLGLFSPGELRAYPPLMRAVDRVVFDPGQEVFYREAEEVLALLKHADVLVVNEHEAERLANAAGGIPALLEGLEALVVTHARGQRIHRHEGQAEVEALPADVVDPTGAGDAHCAGLTHGLAEGMDVVEASRFGSAVAACVVEHVGAQAGLPTLAEARARLGEP